MAHWTVVGCEAMGDKYGEIVVFERAVKGVRVRRARRFGSRKNVYQTADSNLRWGYWYSTQAEAIASSGPADRVCR